MTAAPENNASAATQSNRLSPASFIGRIPLVRAFIVATARVPCPALPRQRRRGSVGQKHSFGGAIKVFVLTCPHRPQECREACNAHSQGYRHQPDKVIHDASANLRLGLSAASGEAPLPAAPMVRRSAFATTKIEEVDMATAAISGVTYPAIATGTTRTL
jgi:hypothetical protein